MRLNCSFWGSSFGTAWTEVTEKVFTDKALTDFTYSEGYTFIGNNPILSSLGKGEYFEIYLRKDWRTVVDISWNPHIVNAGMRNWEFDKGRCVVRRGFEWGDVQRKGTSCAGFISVIAVLQICRFE